MSDVINRVLNRGVLWLQDYGWHCVAGVLVILLLRPYFESAMVEMEYKRSLRVANAPARVVPQRAPRARARAHTNARVQGCYNWGVGGGEKKKTRPFFPNS